MEPFRRMVRMQIADIDTKPQVREEMDPNHVRRLAASIKGCGLQQPIQARMTGDGRAEVVTGHLRLEALRLSGATVTDVLVVDEGIGDPDRLSGDHAEGGESAVHPATEPEARRIRAQLAENAVRRDLDPIEQGKALNLIAQITGASGKALAADFGYTESKVSRLRARASLPAPLLEAVKAKRVSPSIAALLTTVEDEAKRETLAIAVAAGEMTRDELRRFLNAKGNKPKRKSKNKSKVKPDRVGSTLGRVRLTVPGSMSPGEFVSWVGQLMPRACSIDATGMSIAAFLAALRGKPPADEQVVTT